MRFTSRLHAQHLGWSFKKHWQTQGKRIPNDTGAASELEKKEILIKNTGDATAHDKFKTNIGSLTHHQWHDKFCYIYCKETVLLEGLPQAQLLTNTVKIKGLPKSLYELIINLKIPSSVERNAELAVTKSNVYDAEQSSLPRTRNVDRPAYKYPRVYGASQLRSKSDRLGSRGGGVVLRVVNDMSHKLVCKGSSYGDVEYVFVRLLLITVVYLPHGDILALEDEISDLEVRYSNVIIMWDVNNNMFDLNRSVLVRDVCSRLNLSAVHNSMPTHNDVAHNSTSLLNYYFCRI
ncbi:uncharacterized protein LOC101898909 isoform X2 [Musca domestica]|uniref:Uncharacterized protein LOC101898909 isoform X2 n=2 Tax=Musca domestica TaxID=7370 RepID=A0A9J7IF21_MUSDO|nr:uncharacterized protein LOC101898909 isoform X2 [Musca domestica]